MTTTQQDSQSESHLPPESGIPAASLPALQLKKNEDGRLRKGHLWIYSNEVDTQVTPLTVFTPGQQVIVQDNKGHDLGIAYINPHSLICARLISRSTKYLLDKSLLVHRINIALSLRQRFYSEPYYRLLYGESDGVPGLVVDRYGDTLVVQINTAGMEQVKDQIIDALLKTLKPEAIILRNDSSAREIEGLASDVEVAYGNASDTIQLLENNVWFEFPALTGQKTGWFYDHRSSRHYLQALVKDKRVLDVFSYLGAWGIQAAVAGAREVVTIDSSVRAIDFIHQNAALNKVDDKVSSIEGDAFEALQALRQDKQKFDVVILDPPAFIKKKKDHIKGMQAYQRLNQYAMQVMERDSLLVSASCSHHLKRDELLQLMHNAARHVDRQLQIFAQGHQAPDHPIHPAMPETEYLKTFFARVLPN